MTDLALLEKWIATRDAEAFRELALRHASMVYATCRRILGNAAEAEDLAQECFEALAYASRRPETNPGAWLHRVAVRRSLDRVKSDRRRRERETRYADGREASATPDRDDLYAFVDEAVAALPEKLRSPIVSHFIEGRSVTDVAAELGLSRQLASYRIAKGVERIRELLKRRGISVGAPTLAALSAANRAEAAPAGVIAGVGLMAIAGASGPVASTLGVLGGGVVMAKKAFLVLGAVLVLVLLAYVSWDTRGEAARPEVATAPAGPAEGPESLPVPADASSSPAASGPQRARAYGSATAGVAPDGAKEATQAAPAAEKPAEVSGRVTDTEGGIIAEAKVWLQINPRGACDAEATFEAQTGADGRYRITGIDRFGNGEIFAAADEYVMQRGRSLRPAPGARIEGVDFQLPAGKDFVAGRVLTERKTPVAGATLSVPYFAYDEESLARTAVTGEPAGAITETKFLFTLSDDKGRFRMAVPAPGLCDILVRKDGYGRAFFSGIATGTEDAELVLRGHGAIAGRVAHRDGKPAAGVAVQVIGEALVGGLEPSEVAVPSFNLPDVGVYTDAEGHYRAEGLGEDFVYSVKASGIETAPGTAAEKRNVRVNAGRTTSNVDLVLRGTDTRVFGKVTDSASGAPVGGLTVVLGTAEPGEGGAGSKNVTAVTAADGSYEFRLPGLERPARCRLAYLYMTEGGIAWEPRDVEVATLDVSPGSEEEVDFSVDAPVTATALFVDGKGNPLKGILAMVSEAAWPTRACGGQLSGPDGKVTQHGLPPNVALRIAGCSEDGLGEVGASEPFMGRPGEVLREVRVVCLPRGGIRGVLVDAAGAPLAIPGINARAYPADGGSPITFGGFAEAGGSFNIRSALPAGDYARIVAVTGSEGGPYYAGFVENVEIAENGVTDIGPLAMTEITLDQVKEVLGMP